MTFQMQALGLPRRLTGAWAVLLLAVAPAACSRGADQGAAKPTKTIGVSLLTREDEFYRQLEAGLRKAADAHGYAL
ncbi:MAG TPA: hypothetical protein VF737_11090, partial [Gemmatimonadaceae bacterium]